MHTRTIITFIVSFIIISLSFLSLSANDQDLLGQARKIFGSLPEVMPAEKDPITPEKVKLGKILFYETRISIDGTVRGARCHPIGLYGADGLNKSIGNNCKINPRNAP